MAERTADPVVGFWFALEIDGITEATFREASGFGSETQVIEFIEQGAKGVPIIRKVPGNLKWQNITLKRGLTSNTELWAWRQKVIDGKIDEARTNGSIVAYDTLGTEITRFNFTSGWPCKWTSAGLNAQDNSVTIEEIEIAHEGLVRATG